MTGLHNRVLVFMSSLSVSLSLHIYSMGPHTLPPTRALASLPSPSALLVVVGIHRDRSCTILLKSPAPSCFPFSLVGLVDRFLTLFRSSFHILSAIIIFSSHQSRFPPSILPYTRALNSLMVRDRVPTTYLSLRSTKTMTTTGFILHQFEINRLVDDLEFFQSL